jgi:predicted metal-dependent HD superfamily phosphohydrolase
MRCPAEEVDSCDLAVRRRLRATVDDTEHKAREGGADSSASPSQATREEVVRTLLQREQLPHTEMKRRDWQVDLQSRSSCWVEVVHD